MQKDTGKPVDAAAVLLLWTRQTGAVAVSASGNPDNIKKLGIVAGLPDLTHQEVEEISAAGRKVHYRFYVSVGDFFAADRTDAGAV
jgi:diketogulonate reductase-like aldo/keto reductase